VPGTSRQRSALLAVLSEHTSYQSVAELFTELRSYGQPIGLVTVYRHLEAMSRKGTVTTIRGPHGETRYRLHPPAAEHGFTDIQVLVMVTGVCEHCHA
jgi:Fur family transcriptional regulator, ferric uptake regulator